MGLASDPTQLFADELSSASPERLALAIARIAYPDIELDLYLSQLEEMTAVAAATRGRGVGWRRARLSAGSGDAA